MSIFNFFAAQQYCLFFCRASTSVLYYIYMKVSNIGLLLKNRNNAPSPMLCSCGYYFFLPFPVVIVVWLSFTNQSSLQFPPAEYSLRWYTALWNDGQWLASFVRSSEIAALASLIASATGFLFAYALRSRPFAGRSQVLWIALTPIMIPSIIVAIALYFVSAKVGLIGNIYWIALCHAVMALPVAIVILLSTLKNIESNIELAALSLGAGKIFTLAHVIVPLSAAGIVSSMVFVFLSSFDELIISLFLSGSSSQTLPVRIWNSLVFDVEPIITAVSTALIAITSLTVAIDLLMRARYAKRL